MASQILLFWGGKKATAKVMIKYVRIRADWAVSGIEVMIWNSQMVTVIVLLKNVLLGLDDGF